MQYNRRSISWANLPLEILRSIAKLLKQNSNDFRNFRTVCKNWRHSTSISVLLPFCDYSTPSYTLLSSSVFILRPVGSDTNCIPWMVTVIEITKGNIQLCHPFFRTPLSNLPNNLDMTQFHSSRLTESYHVTLYDDHSCSSALSGVDKVLVVTTRLVPCINDCSMLVLHNGRLGGYPSFEEEDDKPDWVDVSHRGVDDFDDIVCYEGVVYAVDWEGKLYQMATDKVFVLKTVVSTTVSSAGAYAGWRKRLVGSSLDHKLYLIVRDELLLRVYKLSKHGKLWTWDIVQRFWGSNQVLFLSKVYGFFADASEFPGRQLRNCIVFSEDAFPVYSFRGWVSHVDAKAEEDVRIFRVGAHDDDHCNFRPILSDPNFPIMLWSPPHWILQAPAKSCFQSNYDQRICKGEKKQLDQEHTVIPPLKSAVIGKEFSVDPTLQTASVTPDHVIQPVVDKVSTVKFQGMDVQSEHLPALQKVWMRHGDVLKDSNIRSSDFLATALASLAKLILILQTNSGKTLTDNQVQYLSSTLSDLQSMQVKVEWLVPYVEKALALHKRKPLDAALAELEKAKAKVEEMKKKFHIEMSQMKEGFSPDKRQLISKTMLASVPINTDTCLGEGLL